MKVFPFLHSGRPLLATGIRTHNQILTPEITRLAPPEPEAFARALRELCDDPALREKIGRAGQAFVERNHTFPAHARRVGSLYGYIERELGRGRVKTPEGSPA
jgi:glycosyltransferase involved in cell wall biosynthesis